MATPTIRNSPRRHTQRSVIPPTPGKIDAPVEPSSAASSAFIEPERRHAMTRLRDRDTIDLRAERKDFPFFERQLRARWLALRTEIRDVLRRADDEQYVQIAGQVHDAEDEALADLLVDINLAEITRDVEELRDVEAALKRIALGTYGVCLRCGEAIARERLGAYLAAKRCTGCQRLYEQTRAKRTGPTL